jgi:hypothetical protein
MSYLKFHLTETENGRFISARCFSGPSFEDNHYSGTLVLPAEAWEHMLDCLIYGAFHVLRNKERLEVYFAPDTGGG